MGKKGRLMRTQKKQDGEEREADENTEEAGWGRKGS